MIEALKDLVEKNYACITTLFYFNNLPYNNIELDNNTPIAQVDSTQFSTLQQIKDYLFNIYTKEEVDRLLNHYYNNRPLYFEKDGVLYLYVEQTTSAGIPYSWKSFEITIIEHSEMHCIFYADVIYNDDPQLNNKTKYTFEAQKTIDGWRLSSLVKNPT